MRGPGSRPDDERDLEVEAAEISESDVGHQSLDASPGELAREVRPRPRPSLEAAPDDRTSSSVVRWVSDPSVPLAETTLSTRESAFIDFLREPANQDLTASEIQARSPLSDDETRRILSALIERGVLEIRERRAREDLSATRAGSDAPVEAAWTTRYRDSRLPRQLGRFVVERTLGHGSMGAVLLAKDPAIDRVVAIKLVQTASHLSPLQRNKYRERFYREASAAGRLLHHTIAAVFDVGHTEDGTPFIVMEYVKGTTLRHVLEEEKLTVPKALRIAKDVLDALGFAHAQGVVHRDVTPSNVMVTPHHRAKIMDFGIAHVVGSELTSAEDVLGSPYYMAPEQLSKGPIDPRTDLFSFAVVLYRMLTGALPFHGDSFAAIAHSILHEDPEPPERLEPAVPKGLSRLLLRLLSKSPDDRLATAGDVLRAIEAIEAGKEELDEEASSKPGRKRWLAACLTLALAGLLLFRLALTGPGTTTAEAPPPAVSTAEPPSAPPPAPRAPDDSSSRASGPARKSPEPPPPKVTPAVEPIGRRHRAEPAPVPPALAEPSEADLFYEARLALERGEFEESKATLETLLARDPSFAGAFELHRRVTDQIWESRLPLVFAARHDHRIGDCEGELSLASLGLRFRSREHDWAFPRDEIRVLERPDERTLSLETFEKDLVGLGRHKRYRFDLESSLRDSDWNRYQRLLK